MVSVLDCGVGHHPGDNLTIRIQCLKWRCSIDIKMDAEVSGGEFFNPVEGLEGHVIGGKDGLSLVRELHFTFHCISVDSKMVVDAGDANHLVQAVPDSNRARRLRSLVQAAEIEPENFELRSVPVQGVNYAF